jgi:asparagine synthase (glutamine-hydrolysing)
MCGLVGFLGRADRATLVAMTDRLAHRGPDGDGYYEHPEQGVNFGHRRLSVIDIAGGDQPMFDEDRSVAVIFNGEIYNHAELRQELVERGYRFRSDHSDTEVLVHGYRQWGVELPARLNGMFAFAIHDARERKLFLCRDRFGEKPLFVFDNGRDFAFASELGAFLPYPAFDAELDDRSVQKFFAYGYLPQPNAIYRNCAKLPAGSWLLVDLDDRSRRSSSYWHFELMPDPSLEQRGEAALVDELRSLLLQAVRRRLISDVPLGLFLSGGIDSSAILAMMSQCRAPEQIESFSIGFDAKSYDETPFASQVAASFGTKHVNQTLSFQQAQEMLQPVLERMDEPLGDASLLPTHLVAGLARKRVTVALSGDGGDELFAGYDPFVALSPARAYASVVPEVVHRLFRRAADRLPKSGANMSLDFKMRRFLTGMSHSASMWLPSWMAALAPERMREVFDAPLPPEELYSEAIDLWTDGERRKLGYTERALEFFTRIYLTDDILVKSDRAAMMHSLESRAVFLDNDLVDFAARLPSRFKYRAGTRKYLLKKAMRGILDDAIIDRRKKGFGIPVADWLKHTPAIVPMQPIDGIRARAVSQLWSAHRAGIEDNRSFLWNWLALQAVRSHDRQRVAAGRKS